MIFPYGVYIRFESESHLKPKSLHMVAVPLMLECPVRKFNVKVAHNVVGFYEDKANSNNFG